MTWSAHSVSWKSDTYNVNLSLYSFNNSNVDFGVKIIFDSNILFVCFRLWFNLQYILFCVKKPASICLLKVDRKSYTFLSIAAHIRMCAQ